MDDDDDDDDWSVSREFKGMISYVCTNFLLRNQVQLGLPSLEQSIYPSKKERLSLIPGRSDTGLELQ